MTGRQTQSLPTAISHNSLYNTGSEHTGTQKSQAEEKQEGTKRGREGVGGGSFCL